MWNLGHEKSISIAEIWIIGVMPNQIGAHDVDIPIDINCDCSIIRAKTNSWWEDNPGHVFVDEIALGLIICKRIYMYVL